MHIIIALCKQKFSNYVSESWTGHPTLGIISWPAERDGGRPREGERRAQSRKGNKVFIKNLKGNKVIVKVIKGIHQEFKSGTTMYSYKEFKIKNTTWLGKSSLWRKKTFLLFLSFARVVWSILVFQVTGADGPVQEGNWPARGHNLRFVGIRLTINVYSQFGVFLVRPTVGFLFSIDIVFSGWALLRPESNYLNDHHFRSNAWFGRWCAVSEGRSQNFRILLVTLWDKPDACEYKCSHFFGTALERTTTLFLLPCGEETWPIGLRKLAQLMMQT